MGANQSTNGSNQGGAQQKAGGAAKICYYELLDIEPQATEEEWVLSCCSAQSHS